MAEALYLPFDEPDGSGIAYDYSPGAHHADIIDGRFTAGREGNCVYFPGSGYAQVEPLLIDFEDPYSIIFWAQAIPTTLGPTTTWLLVKYAEPDQFLRLEFKTPLSSWTHLAFTHENGAFCTYVNAKKVDSRQTPPGWGIPTGYVILNDNGLPDLGRCMLDDYRILTGEVITESGLIPIISNSTLPVKFSIDGTDLKSLGIEVSQDPRPKGLTDKLPVKEGNSYNWSDQHGRQVDLYQKRYDIRNIELSCWFTAIGKDAMLENQMAIKELFQKDGSQRLMVDIGSKPLVYEVDMPDEIDFSDMKWRDGKSFCSFTLKFRELQPVKRVLRYVVVDGNTPDLTIGLTTPKGLSIYWGDGSHHHNIKGNALTLTHEYEQPGTYYIVIAGVIERITNFTTNAVIVWNKLQ